MSNLQPEQSDPAQMRRDYAAATIEDGSLDANPIHQFRLWFDDAIKLMHTFEVNAMTLATVQPTGMPAARIVLLKGVDEQGFVFYTNTRSAKARELQHDSRCALLFHWHPLERQVRIEGEVEAVDRDIAEHYFQSRPRLSQIAAWASSQSHPIGSRDEMQKAFARAEKRFEGTDPLPLPDFWGGYRVKPHAFEFWQGGRSRLHDRIRYEKENDGWIQQRLQP